LLPTGPGFLQSFSPVIANAKAAGVADPFFAHLPAINDLPFSAKSLDL